MNYSVVTYAYVDRLLKEGERDEPGEYRKHRVKCGEIHCRTMREAKLIARALHGVAGMEAEAVYVHFNPNGGRALLTPDDMERIADALRGIED